MTKRNIRVLLVSQARSGTAFWRVKNPLEYLRDVNCCELAHTEIDRIPTRDRFWLEWFDVVVFHQVWSDDALMFCRYMKSIGKRIVLSVDDLINGYKIPSFISGGAPYRDNGIAHNIHDMMVIADRIIVTQPFLAEQLGSFFEIPVERFVCFPNLPSYNWLGRNIDPAKKVSKFMARGRGKLRVGLISSLSHYRQDEAPKENSILPQKDDLEIVEEAASDLKDRGIDITYVMTVGKNNTVGNRLSKYGKVECQSMVPIRTYPNMVADLDLDLVVVPLQHNDFNDSKSNIKLIECAALGIPVLVSDSFAYRGFIDEKYMFGDGRELAAKVVWVRSWDEKTYLKTITDNYNRFFANKSMYYGRQLDTYWLEKNLTLVGDTFLKYDDEKKSEDGIVAPMLKQQEVNGNGKTEEDN